MSRRVIISNLVVYGTLHAAIDFACVGLLFTAAADPAITTGKTAFWFVLYNVLAFGLQYLLGLASDFFGSSSRLLECDAAPPERAGYAQDEDARSANSSAICATEDEIWRRHALSGGRGVAFQQPPRAFAFSGGILTVTAALIFRNYPTLAIVLAGSGNAFFHVGAGTISLALTPGKATAPGLFVAPGAIGVLAGMTTGKAGLFRPVVAVALLGILLLISRAVPPVLVERDRNRVPATQGNGYSIMLGALLLAVAVRSLVGLSVIFPWKADPVLAATLVAAIVAGKGVGGVLADRFGWLRVACASLLGSLPLVAFGSGIPFLAIVGIFLFNFTMPITLAAVSNLLPGRQGFAFGLTCLALLIGALPVLLGFNVFSRPPVIFASIGLSLIAVWVGLDPRLQPTLATAPKKT
jgi:MFS transporter, FSR family, fosmidomycin resistance protein